MGINSFSPPLHFTPSPLPSPTSRQSVQLPRPPRRARAKLPPAGVPGAGDIQQAPFDGGRDGRPVGPRAVLRRAVQVQQEEGHDVERAGLGHRALAPAPERGGGARLLGGPGRRRVWVRGQLRDRGDLAVEVVRERLLEVLHDIDERLAAELGGPGLHASQVRRERGEPAEEGLVLGVRGGPDGGVVAEDGGDLREEHGLLVVVVRGDELVPRPRVPDEVGLVGRRGHVRRLLVDRVVAAQDGVVQQRHVRGAGREDVGLL